MTTPAPTADLQAGVAILNAAHQVIEGQMTEGELGNLVVGYAKEQLWTEPDAMFNPVFVVAYLGLRLASLFATATDTDVETVLGFLGAEVASLPDA